MYVCKNKSKTNVTWLQKLLINRWNIQFTLKYETYPAHILSKCKCLNVNVNVYYVHNSIELNEINYSTACRCIILTVHLVVMTYTKIMLWLSVYSLYLISYLFSGPEAPVTIDFGIISFLLNPMDHYQLMLNKLVLQTKF